MSATVGWSRLHLYVMILAFGVNNELAYLEPSDATALRDNKNEGFGLKPELLRTAIHWHHNITPYSG